MSLFWRVFLANAAVFAVATLALALSPVTVSSPLDPREGAVLAAGLSAILLANVFVLRYTFTPLGRLVRLMQRADLLQPERLPPGGTGEIAEVVATFNEMLDRLEAERRASALRVLVGVEAERRRVARELHDEVGQALTAVLLQLKRVAARAPDELEGEIAEAQEAARASLEEIRRIALQLRPGVLEDLGVVSALTALTSAFSARTGTAVERRFDGPLPPLEPEAEIALYRVAQESLTNVARHADASSVLVRLSAGDGHVELEVTDDGRGLALNGNEGGGIRGMRERALAVGGRLGIEPRERGVSVRLRLPVPEREVA